MNRPTDPLTLLTNLNGTDLMENSKLLKPTKMNSRNKFKVFRMNWLTESKDNLIKREKELNRLLEKHKKENSKPETEPLKTDREIKNSPELKKRKSNMSSK